MSKLPKFAIGDLVWIKKITKPYKAHFQCERKAVVAHYLPPEGTYRLVMLSDDGRIDRCSWYESEDLEHLRRISRDEMLMVMAYEENEEAVKKILSNNDPADSVNMHRHLNKVLAPKRPMRPSKRSIERELRRVIRRLERHKDLDRSVYYAYGQASNALVYYIQHLKTVRSRREREMLSNDA